MIDRIKWQLAANNNRTGSKDTDQKTAAKSGAISYGNTVQLLPSALGNNKGLVDYRDNSFNMASGGNFWNNTAVNSMQGHAAGNNIT
jgi:hypothetical protein